MKKSDRIDKADSSGSDNDTASPVVTRGRYARSSATPKKTRRRKRSAEEAREESIAAARSLLLEGGPGAVTVSNVGKRVGMSHGNVLHHFGSAAGLQASLMGAMVDDLADALESAVVQIRDDPNAQRSVIEQVFEALTPAVRDSLLRGSCWRGISNIWNRSATPCNHWSRHLPKRSPSRKRKNA